MNKRMKKKQLKNQVQGTKEAVDILFNIVKKVLDENTFLKYRIEKLESLESRNVQAINERFEQLEAENKVLRRELDKLKQAKRSLFRDKERTLFRF